MYLAKQLIKLFSNREGLSSSREVKLPPVSQSQLMTHLRLEPELLIPHPMSSGPQSPLLYFLAVLSMSAFYSDIFSVFFQESSYSAGLCGLLKYNFPMHQELVGFSHSSSDVFSVHILCQSTSFAFQGPFTPPAWRKMLGSSKEHTSLIRAQSDSGFDSLLCPKL